MRNRLAGAVLSGLLIVGYVGAGAVLMGSSACATVKPPSGLSAVGQIAFYGDRIEKAIGAIQDVAIQGEASKVISTNDARKIIEATKIAGQAGVDLSAALKAGSSAATAKDKAIAVIKQVLTDLPPQLDANTRKLIAPFVSVVMVLLTALGG